MKYRAAGVFMDVKYLIKYNKQNINYLEDSADEPYMIIVIII